MACGRVFPFAPVWGNHAWRADMFFIALQAYDENFIKFWTLDLALLCFSKCF